MASENSLREDAVAGALPEIESAEGSRSTSAQTEVDKADAGHQPLPPEVLQAKPPGDSLTWVWKGF